MTKPLVLGLLTCASLLALAPVAGAVDLTKLGSTPAQGEAQAEIAAYDPDTEQAFVTNAEDNTLDIYDFSDPTNLGDPVSIDLSPYGAGPNSVDVSKDGLVAVAVEADPITAQGSVEIFDTDGNHLHSFPAGSLPDMLTFAKHDDYLLVANEGEALSDDDDPQGSVTVIRLHKKLSRSTVKTAGFAGVPRVGEYRIACPGTPFVQDAEPEYISEGGFGTALVTLQEVNAVGVLDIERGRFVLVRGLGYKDHGRERNALDPSDEDGGININPWDGLEGMYQPDAIASYTWFGLPYYVTANEGDAREREGCEEEERIEDLVLDPTAFPNAAELQAEEALGRLNVSNTTGDTDGDGDFDRLFSFGARSFSILGPLGGLLWDSGSQLERIAAAEEPDRFNFSNEEPGELDERSDSKGPEPEGIDVGTVGFRTYAFVASERQGGIYAYRLQGPSASYEDYLNARPEDLGPEGVQFVSRSDSPTGRAMLLVTNEISGTVTAIDVAP
jgi:2',3'-cyclic-nucleotide 2'-phosphodiesterase / 3'-nucleotidase / 5'-nucleotidase